MKTCYVTHQGVAIGLTWLNIVWTLETLTCAQFPILCVSRSSLTVLRVRRIHYCCALRFAVFFLGLERGGEKEEQDEADFVEGA